MPVAAPLKEEVYQLPATLGAPSWQVGLLRDHPQLRRSLLGSSWFLPVALFVLMVGYQGVRVGRSTHIVDMATADLRPAYVALSNTAIGILLMVSTAFGALAQTQGEAAVLALFAVMCLGAAATSRGLDEVQGG